MATTAKTFEGMKTVDEADVSISCFISQLPGFRGILKQRYAVNEVDIDCNVVRLTSLDLPSEMELMMKPIVLDPSSDNSKRTRMIVRKELKKLANMLWPML